MQKTPILIDTDANNELDDQHAMAYAMFSCNEFQLAGFTVNNTPNGNGIQGQYDEAKRVMQLCASFDRYPLYKGADANFDDIKHDIDSRGYDGEEAVDFIVESALASTEQKLILIPIGKLTNVALALLREPKIIDKVRVVWLGSNYPDVGEYNLAADPGAVNFVIDSGVEFEMVTVRYMETTGSMMVKVDGEEIRKRMAGLGPRVPPITGRHGGEFSTFGDYAISLFENFNFATRPLFDVVAVAVVKNPSWGKVSTIKAPRLDGIRWTERANTTHSIKIWEHFAVEEILKDFFKVMEKPCMN